MIRPILFLGTIALPRVLALDASSVTPSTTAAVRRTIAHSSTEVPTSGTSPSTTASVSTTPTSVIDTSPLDQGAVKMYQTSDISTFPNPGVDSTWLNPSKPTRSQSLVPSPATTPPPFHIKHPDHTSRCLGVTNTNEQDQDIPVVLRDCSDGHHQILWQLQSTTLPTRIVSWAFADQPWCLDAGPTEGTVGSVVINNCDDNVPPGQVWQWTVDMHLVVYNQSRNVDLEDGIDVGGGHIQTWPYVFNNTNQIWMLEPVPIATSTPEVQLRR